MALKLITGCWEDWGIIPGFLTDDRPAAVQIDERYIGGWKPNPRMNARWKLTGTKPDYRLKYPGDPPSEAISVGELGCETIVMFPSAFVAIVQPDGSWAVDRLD
jgi:hypothetical protein